MKKKYNKTAKSLNMIIYSCCRSTYQMSKYNPEFCYESLGQRIIRTACFTEKKVEYILRHILNKDGEVTML